MASEKARSPEWPKVRAAHLQHDPVCNGCGIDRDLEVHHVVPFHIDPSKELDDSNLLTLCEHPGHDCHFGFGHDYDWRAYVPSVRDDVKAYRARVVKR